MTTNQSAKLSKSLGTWQVTVSGVALVVAASTLVSDFTGFFTLGWSFAIALLLGFGVNLLLGLSAADLSVAHPRAGAIYDYARLIFRGRMGQFLGVFLGLTFFGMGAFAVAGETAAGAMGLRSLIGSEADLGYFIALLGVLAVAPNLLGIRTAAWVSAGLLILMLGIRWMFGLAGFLGLSRLGPWSAANLDAGVGAFDWFSEPGIITVGLALALWTYVGIEFSCSLAEEVKDPGKSMPRGIVFGLLAILATSVIMGIGVTGTQPITMWQSAISGELGQGGEAPHLVVGQLMFGNLGFRLMALAAVSATLGSLTVLYATMPRILYGIARDGCLGPASCHFAALHRHHGTPVNATLFTLGIYLIPALACARVMDWVFSAAYVWILLYIVYHVLAIASRLLRPDCHRAFGGRWIIPAAALGIAATLVALWFAFAGQHSIHGLRALAVLALALAATVLSFALPAPRGRAPSARAPLSAEEAHVETV